MKDPKNLWAKVQQLTGQSKSRGNGNSANQWNDHYAAISTDANYKPPSMKLTANSNQITDVSEWQIFRILDGLKKTATGLYGIPAWFLKIGAPFFSAVIADSVNLSLATGVVPSQWKTVCIVPVPKIAVPICPADYRPISITPILSGIVERIVVKEYIYPSFQCTQPMLDFSDQFAFQPTASTTVAHLLQTIINHLHTNPYVIVYAMDFSKAYDSVRHKSVLDKFAQLEIPDNIYNWIQDFFNHHSHCTKFGDEVSNFQSIFVMVL